MQNSYNIKKIPFSTRISIYIIILVSALFLCVFTYNYYKVHRSIYDLSIENAQTLAQSNVEKIERILQKVEQVPLYVAHIIATEKITKEEITNFIFHFVESNPDVYGATIAIAPELVRSFTEGKLEYFAPYYYKVNEEVLYADLANNEYRYWEESWFLDPAKLEKPFWSEPYFDADGGNTLMATFSVPIYRQTAAGKKYFVGVITADISLSWLQKIVDDIKIYNTGSLSLLSRAGMFIAFPNKDYVMRADYTIFDLAKEKNTKQLQEFTKKLTSEKSGRVAFKAMNKGDDMELLFTHLPSTDWFLIVTIPNDELFEELFEQTVIIILLAIVGIFGIVILVSLISYRATKPLRQLTESTKEIAQGNLDINLPCVKYLDEIGELSLSFENMRTALKEYIRNLTRATAAQERIESELKIAKNIQTSFLPKTCTSHTARINKEDIKKSCNKEKRCNHEIEKVSVSSLKEENAKLSIDTFSESRTFDIYATLIPAREVGGDLYDFFYLDEKHIFISVGDVSGKGVPASLFMAVTQTLIKTIATHEKDPATILYKVNNSLAKDNAICMFVTLFCGILNIQTGELMYTNAGHESPILLRQSEPVNSGIHSLDLPKGFALGVLEGAKYQNKSIQLRPHDKLVLFTDGVTDAQSLENSRFGKLALYAVLERCKESSIQETIISIQNAVEKHANGTEQFDDITLLSLSWHGVKIGHG